MLIYLYHFAYFNNTEKRGFQWNRKYREWYKINLYLVLSWSKNFKICNNKIKYKNYIFLGQFYFNNSLIYNSIISDINNR